MHVCIVLHLSVYELTYRYESVNEETMQAYLLLLFTLCVSRVRTAVRAWGQKKLRECRIYVFVIFTELHCVLQSCRRDMWWRNTVLSACMPENKSDVHVAQVAHIPFLLMFQYCVHSPSASYTQQNCRYRISNLQPPCLVNVSCF